MVLDNTASIEIFVVARGVGGSQQWWWRTKYYSIAIIIDCKIK